jgi:voltage-gated sodium channel
MASGLGVPDNSEGEASPALSKPPYEVSPAATSRAANAGDHEQDLVDTSLIEKEQSLKAKGVSKEIKLSGRLFGDILNDPDEIKKRVRAKLTKAPPYNVQEFYWKDGRWSSEIAKHYLFENTTLAVICLNAVYIAVDTDWNKPDPFKSGDTSSLTESAWPFQVMEHFFAVYFTGEILIRFLAFERKSRCFCDGWFVFDSLLVTLMVLETWVLLIYMAISGSSGGGLGGTSILRLFRLLRLSRLMRMLRSLPELMILIKGMVAAMKSVAYVMVLLMLITYVFAIAFTQLVAEGEDFRDLREGFFLNVAHAMYSLLIYAVFLDNLASFMDALLNTDAWWYLLPLAWIFVCLAALTVMNMLIGVLCEVVSAVAETEKQEVFTIKITEQMREFVKNLDSNFDNHVSYDEFSRIIENKDAVAALKDVGVNPLCLVEFAELFFFEGNVPIKLSFEGFMEMVLDLREDNEATVKDVLNLWMRLKQTTHKDLKKLDQKVSDLNCQLDTRTSKITANLKQAILEMKQLTMTH